MGQFLTWFAMGGYSAYVWPAYSIVFAVLLFNFLGVKRQKKRLWRSLNRWFKG